MNDKKHAAIMVTPTPNKPLQVCTRCIFNSETPSIKFDEKGVCNYCQLAEDMEREYPNGEAGEKILKELAEKIKKGSRRRKYDVLVGVSGGCDSSLLVVKAVELGLRPLAVHFDNTWNSTVAVENINCVLNKLGVKLHTHVVDNEVYDDIYRAFMESGSPDVDSPTDIALAATLYEAAEKYGIQYIFEGHSFRTEGVSPLGWLYMDGKYVQSVVKEYGHYHEHKLKTYPNLWLSKFLKWTAIDRIKKVRPLYWMDYNKEETKKMLHEKYGWQWYGGHHLENRFTAFYYSYYLPVRLGIDQRFNGYAALARSGQMTRDEALSKMKEPPEYDFEIVEMVKKRLGYSDEEFDRLMKLPRKDFREFKTYKPLFEKMRPLFYLLYKCDLVHKSFYVKYTSRSDI